MEIFHIRTYECSTAPEKNKNSSNLRDSSSMAMLGCCWGGLPCDETMLFSWHHYHPSLWLPLAFFPLPARPTSVYESVSYSWYLRGQYPLISPWLISFTQRPACFFPLYFQYLLIQHHWVHSGAPLLMPRRLLQSLFHFKAKNQPLHQKHASENSSPVSTWTFRSSRPFVCSSNSTPTVKSTL